MKHQNPKKWTEANVINVRPESESNDTKVKHPSQPGLAIRFQNQNPVGTFTFYFTLAGRSQKFPIGKVGAITLKFAEDEAKRHAAAITGTAPVNPIIQRAKAVTNMALPMAEKIEDFLQSQRDKKRSAQWVATQERQLTKLFKRLHTIPLRLIDKPTVIECLDKIKVENGGIAMTSARATLSKFFNWCQSRSYCEHNPVEHTEVITSRARDRVLQPNELAIIWHAADAMEREETGLLSEYGRIVKLLILTGARRSQIGGLRKFELNTNDAMISLGGAIGIREAKRLARLGQVEHESLSKNRQTFLIPLSRQVVKMFKAQPVKNHDYVFGGAGEGYSNWSNGLDELKRRIRDRVKADWVLHDFRRSFETLGQDKVKIPHHITDICINHTPEAKRGVRKHYNFALLIDERVTAMQAWADYIEKIVKNHEPPKLRLVA